MDALAGLKRIAPDSVDLVVTDPPYNIAAKDRITMRSSKPMSTYAAWGSWDSLHPFDYDLLIMSVISECYRILKPGGSLYMFTAREQNGYFVRKAVARRFTYRNQLVMAKKNPLPSLSKSNWRSAFEVCMYVTKGKPKVFNFLSQAECKNVFHYSNTKRYTRHPTEKPLDLIELMIKASSNECELVLDPFMGSGTTAVAAKALGRRYLGFETDLEYVRMARERLNRTDNCRPHPN
jgi:site-specific DNA-methyltransferase (adenine-specific)